MRIELQQAFILHTRPYRDTSLLLDLLTEHHGRIALIAKGARRPKYRQRQLLQPFIPLKISWQGKSQLKTLTAVEANGEPYPLHRQYLYSALYANELLYYLLLPEDPLCGIFELYQYLLQQLNQGRALEIALRTFELSLLEDLGYGIDFSVDAATAEPVVEEKFYHFAPDTGFIASSATVPDSLQPPSQTEFMGAHLRAIAQGDYQDEAVLRSAKKITRVALECHLQGKALKSRELFKGFLASTRQH